MIKRKKLEVSTSEEVILGRVRDGEMLIDEQGRIWKLVARYWSCCQHCSKPQDRGMAPKRAETKAGSGYMYVRGERGNKRFSALAHRVVWTYLSGPIPQGMEINHKNGIKDDNRPENLELVTPSENMLHASRVLGRIYSFDGKGNPHTRLTEEDVIQIRERLSNGEEAKNIARDFKITSTYVGMIKRGKAWRHVS